MGGGEKAHCFCHTTQNVGKEYISREIKAPAQFAT